ncbi:hypothetical protein ACK8OR_07360 [Jannaschia sp. KMU-145]|uniref:hypothetical protein n=1 Tax=Jannaschia halovivens TaxID=3388667 RepID=UPI00396B0369
MSLIPLASRRDHMDTRTKLDPFRNALLAAVSAGREFPPPQPLDISPWLAMSLLQKSVRRGRCDLALKAAATLYRDAPDRLWRRLGGIAFEDVGLANLQAVGLTTAALTGKRFRRDLGGDWNVASVVVQRLTQSRKSRACDDLFMALEAMPSLAADRHTLSAETNPRLRLTALTTPSLHTRALSILFLLGTDRPGWRLPVRRGEVALAFDLLDELGTAPTTLAICREGYRKTQEAMPPLLALLALENGLRDETTNDRMPEEAMIGPVPGWALDMFTREGKMALTRLLVTDAGIAEFARSMVPKQKQVGFLGQALFRVEGGLLARRLGGDLSDRLQSQLLYETLGVEPQAAVQALDLIQQDLPLLNRIRQTVIGGQRDG